MPVTHGVAGSSPVRTAKKTLSKTIREGFSVSGNEIPDSTAFPTLAQTEYGSDCEMPVLVSLEHLVSEILFKISFF
jgi:hypothetical protein